MNCNLTDSQREAGSRCRSFECIGCRNFSKVSLISRLEDKIDKLEKALKEAKDSVEFTAYLFEEGTTAAEKVLTRNARLALKRIEEILK